MENHLISDTYNHTQNDEWLKSGIFHTVTLGESGTDTPSRSSLHAIRMSSAPLRGIYSLTDVLMRQDRR